MNGRDWTFAGCGAAIGLILGLVVMAVAKTDRGTYTTRVGRTTYTRPIPAPQPSTGQPVYQESEAQRRFSQALERKLDAAMLEAAKRMEAGN